MLVGSKRPLGARPGWRFWAKVVVAALLLVLFVRLSGWHQQKWVPVVADFLGMSGSLILLYATAQSLPTRERLTKLSALQNQKPSDPISAALLAEMVGEELVETHRHLTDEWRLTLIGAGALCAGFGLSLAHALG